MLITDKFMLRAVYKSARNSINKALKSNYDTRIFTRLINSEIYKNADLILIYVSFGSEADTRNIIDYSLKHGKRVAVPLCKEREMHFYEINSLNELVTGKFGIPTVISGNNSAVDNFENALCIVPGLCFDFFGNRVGYGGGFYDRFLKEHKVPTIGLTYELCICNQIPFEEFDVSIDAIITENYFRNSEQGGSTYE